MLETIQEYLGIVAPYLPYILPITLGLLAAFAGTRTIRLVRAENTEKSDWKTWQLRVFSGIICWPITAILWWMLNGRSWLAITDGLVYGLVVGLASPFIWQIVIIKLQEKYPQLELLNTLHPKKGIK